MTILEFADLGVAPAVGLVSVAVSWENVQRIGLGAWLGIVLMQDLTLRFA